MGKVISEFGNIVGGGSSIQLSSMPTYTDVSLGTIVQYIGATNETYTNGYFYKRGASGWENVNVQEGSSGGVFTITLTGDGDETPYSVDRTPEEVATAYANGLILRVIENQYYEGQRTDDWIYKLNEVNYSEDEEDPNVIITTYSFVSTLPTPLSENAIAPMTVQMLIELIATDDLLNWNHITYNYSEDSRVFQYEFMPGASASNLGKIVQYVGSTNSTYTNGYFYKCVSDGALIPTYSWQRIDIQPHQDISGKADMPIEITYAAYQLLSEQDKNTHRYVITDYPSVGGVAIDDTTTANNKVYSSEKVAELVTDLDIKENILGKLPVEISAVNDELVNKPDTTQYIILYVDDARQSLPTIWNVIKEYNIPINLAVPTWKLNATCVDGRKVKEVLHEMEDAGCEIVSHSTSDDPFYAQTTRAEAYARLKNSKEALLTEGFKVHGFAKPGGGDDFTECGFDDLVRELYLYSDTAIFPVGIHRRRATLVQSGVTIQNILNSIKRGKNGQRLFCHGFDSDVTEEYLREFISTALAQGFVFTTEYDFYTKHSYSITNDRLLKLERLMEHYNQLDMYLMRGGLGRPIYDVSAYPYAFIYNTADRRIVVSDAPLMRDGSGSSYVYKKSDGSAFAYKRFKYASGEWVADGSSSSATAFDSVVKGSTNPEVTNYDMYDENGTLVLACEDAYVY